jgi:hypothetical protein
MDTEKTPFPKYDGRPYETQDVELKPVIKFAVIMAAVVIASFLVSIPIYWWIEPERAPTIHSERPEAMQRVLPPEPRVQANPVKDWEEFAKQEEAKVKTYKWVDMNTGKAQIPVERAKEIALEKGLPKPKPTISGTGGDNPKPATKSGEQGVE